MLLGREDKGLNSIEMLELKSWNTALHMMATERHALFLIRRHRHIATNNHKEFSSKTNDERCSRRTCKVQNDETLQPWIDIEGGAGSNKAPFHCMLLRPLIVNYSQCGPYWYYKGLLTGNMATKQGLELCGRYKLEDSSWMCPLFRRATSTFKPLGLCEELLLCLYSVQ